MADAYASVPRVTRTDDSLRLWREGYTYVSSRCDDLGTDIFRTRLLLMPAFCMRGAEAAELFYGSDLFTRTGAMPKSALHLLQDEGSVQTLDDAAHEHRKQLFLPMLEPDAADGFADELEQAWAERTARSGPGDRLVLHDELNRVLTTAALRWCGLPAAPDDVELRCRELAAMVNNAGTVGPRNWLARLLRRRSERWAAATLAEIRDGRQPATPGAMADRIATFSAHGTRLPLEIAATELLNVLRPIVAIARFGVFAALALWQHPSWKERLASGDDGQLHSFVQEVRRFYPFFPIIGGRARRAFEWSGYDFPENAWLLLDLYGTNHDGRRWAHPESFRPERFEEEPPGVYDFVPQGGGEYASTHRCPGERLTIAAVARLVRLLSTSDYRVPAQDLTFPMSTMPTLPRSGFVLVLEPP